MGSYDLINERVMSEIQVTERATTAGETAPAVRPSALPRQEGPGRQRAWSTNRSGNNCAQRTVCSLQFPRERATRGSARVGQEAGGRVRGTFAVGSEGSAGEQGAGSGPAGLAPSAGSRT